MDQAPLIARPHPAVSHWQWARLPELASTALYAVLAARQRVFAVEQVCAYLDADGLDLAAWHLLGWAPDPAQSLVAYLRVVDPGQRYAEPSIGRVLTSAAVRRRGVGRALMDEGIAGCTARHPGLPVRIAAQSHLEPFYSELGFATVSAPYDEDGIPHVEMLLRARAPVSPPIDGAPVLR